MSTFIPQREGPRADKREPLESAVVRFAGDSGDGIQVTGGRFAETTALAGNDLATFPDFPAEIRAPAGTTYGVSAFQINFGARAVMTPGDAPDTLVALNPAAFKVELGNLKRGGLVIVDTGTFNERNLRKAGYDHNPLTEDSLDGYCKILVNISQMTLDAVKEFGLSQKEALRCKNMWALGLVYWLYARKRGPTVDWLRQKFSKQPDIAAANIAALNAGHAFGETAELPRDVGGYVIEPAHIAPGVYRTITGGEAMAYGLAVGAHLAGLKLVLGSYPITPASPILHVLSTLHQFGVVTLQAEDEISAICAAIGASYAGAIGATSSSGPGMALKSEALGLAICAELPLVVINTQRAGPSTGMPTKTEQSDLFQAVFGRNADSPLVVLAARSPADCFDVAIEAVRIAVTYMTPVIALSDGYIANAAQPWRIPEIEALPPINVHFRTDPEGFQPYLRDPKSLARVWAIPGTPGLEHRIGGIEKDYDTGHISYDPANHQRMTDARMGKIAGIAKELPPQKVEQGADSGPLVIVSWGSTYGAITRAVSNCRQLEFDVAHIHLRHLSPLPANLGDLLRGYRHILVPEMNCGQLVTILRAAYLLPAEGLSKVAGQPFRIAEIEAAIQARLGRAKERSVG
jgi:2-oxoglutarate ferredoxin oxidoreductase subunit alpha